MRLEGNKVILEDQECWWCGSTGLAAGQESCLKCGGTGKGPKGGARGCRRCSGFGRVRSEVLKVTCGCCKGTGRKPETDCDYMPKDMYLALPFKVYRHERLLTYGENLLGWGCVYSCTDYGRSYGATDESVLADVRSDSHCGVQLCKVAKNLELCNHIGIFVAANGYSVRAVYRTDGLDALATIASERSYSDGMVTGMKIAAAGGNGTLGGIFK